MKRFETVGSKKKQKTMKAGAERDPETVIPHNSTTDWHKSYECEYVDPGKSSRQRVWTF